MDAVFKTTTEYMNYSEDVVEGVSPLEISKFGGPRSFLRIQNSREWVKSWRRSITLEGRCFSQDPYFSDESKTSKECVIYPKDVVIRVNILEDQWIWKNTLLLRNGNLKGEIIETSKTEGEIFTKNVVDGLRY